MKSDLTSIGLNCNDSWLTCLLRLGRLGHRRRLRQVRIGFEDVLVRTCKRSDGDSKKESKSMAQGQGQSAVDDNAMTDDLDEM